MSKTEFLQEENIQVYFPSNVYDYNEQGRQKERVLVKIDLFLYSTGFNHVSNRVVPNSLSLERNTVVAGDDMIGINTRLGLPLCDSINHVINLRTPLLEDDRESCV